MSSPMSAKSFIIAEAGVNHNGEVSLAHQLIDVAAESGVDAVKFQTFNPGRLVTKNAAKARYQTENLQDDGLSQFEMLEKLQLPDRAFIELKKHADECGITFLSTPFDFESVDTLESLVPFYKISSGDCVNLPFLRYIAQKEKPVILSTGMTTLEEVGKAVAVFPKDFRLTLLHCTSNYPCPFGEVNLNAMLTLKSEFKRPVGYSDHTVGIEIPIAAVALGASVIEKHFTLNRNMEGPDHKASLEPMELKEMVRQIRNVEKGLGDGIKRPQCSELETATVARRSLVFSRSLKEGTAVSAADLEIKRPGTGLSPDLFDQVIGLRLKRDVQGDELVSWDLLI